MPRKQKEEEEEKSIDNLLKKAKDLCKSDNFEEAIEIYSKILEKDPKNAEALKYRGESRRLILKIEFGID